ncbi:MAG: hypothetical protein ACYSTX_04170 [Planctomycetota bacterium]|jgi:hypothetical protein
MENASSHILKGDQVQFDGAFQLNSATSARQPVRKKSAPSSSMSVQAVIVEHNDEFALVEVTCSCGTIIPVKCTYANQKPSEDTN